MNDSMGIASLINTFGVSYKDSTAHISITHNIVLLKFLGKLWIKRELWIWKRNGNGTTLVSFMYRVFALTTQHGGTHLHGLGLRVPWLPLQGDPLSPGSGDGPRPGPCLRQQTAQTGHVHHSPALSPQDLSSRG